MPVLASEGLWSIELSYRSTVRCIFAISRIFNQLFSLLPFLRKCFCKPASTFTLKEVYSIMNYCTRTYLHVSFFSKCSHILQFHINITACVVIHFYSLCLVKNVAFKLKEIRMSTLDHRLFTFVEDEYQVCRNVPKSPHHKTALSSEYYMKSTLQLKKRYIYPPHT
jgi:hypothetical protein